MGFESVSDNGAQFMLCRLPLEENKAGIKEKSEIAN